jgi:hypothetical protein
MYENSLQVNPVIRNFWRNLKKNNDQFHPFKKNKNLVFFGDELSRKSFDFISERLSKLKSGYSAQDITEFFLHMSILERGHTDLLQNLAVEAVSQAFEIPEELLSPNLNENSNVETNQTEEKFNKEFDYDSLDQSTKDQINKRILINCIIQGSSIHSFYTVHHLVKDNLDAIDPELISYYDKFSVGSVRSYYSVDYSSFLENENFDKSMVLGSTKVEYDNEENPKVIAHAKSFPVLCQELVKGAIETICLHSLENISKNELEKIYYFADKRQDEPRYIQISAEIWRNILEFKKYCANNNEKHSTPELVMKISKIPPKEIEDFFEFLLQGDYNEAIGFI